MYKRRYGRQTGKRQSRGGRRADLGNRYYRSMMEANVARVLMWQAAQGLIQKWEYEADEFKFPIERGTRFYKPDFKIWNTDGSVVYWEVKGWMDPKSRTQLKRMKKFYPAITVVVIGREEYKQFEREVAPFLSNWETTAAVTTVTGETVRIGRHTVTDPALLKRIEDVLNGTH